MKRVLFKVVNGVLEEMIIRVFPKYVLLSDNTLCMLFWDCQEENDFLSFLYDGVIYHITDFVSI